MSQQGGTVEKSCPQCQQRVNADDKFCSNCATPLSTDSRATASFNHAESGGDSINFAGGTHTFNRSPISIIGKYEASPHEPVAIVERVYQKQLSLFGHAIKEKWFTITTALSAIASIVTIQTGLFSGDPTAFPYTLIGPGLLVFTLACAYLTAQLKSHRFLMLPGALANLEIAKDNCLYLTRVSAPCPYCSAMMDVFKVGEIGQKIPILICRRNPSLHRHVFDHTMLEDINQP